MTKEEELLFIYNIRHAILTVLERVLSQEYNIQIIADNLIDAIKEELPNDNT